MRYSIIARNRHAGLLNRDGAATAVPSPKRQDEIMQTILKELQSWVPKLKIATGDQSEIVLPPENIKWEPLRGTERRDQWLTEIHSLGWEFVFRNGKLFGWTAPDAFFDRNPPHGLKRFLAPGEFLKPKPWRWHVSSSGKWTQAQMSCALSRYLQMFENRTWSLLFRYRAICLSGHKRFGVSNLANTLIVP